jgi:hypothetical protein
VANFFPQKGLVWQVGGYLLAQALGKQVDSHMLAKRSLEAGS